MSRPTDATPKHDELNSDGEDAKSDAGSDKFDGDETVADDVYAAEVADLFGDNDLDADADPFDEVVLDHHQIRFKQLISKI